MTLILGQQDLIKVFVDFFNQHQIHYLLTGSLAGSYYGYPRATHDVDFIIEIIKKDSGKLVKALKDLGKPFIIDKTEIEEAIAKSFQFNLYHPETGIKIDFWIVGNNDFEKNKFKRERKILLDKDTVNLISAEDLILTKLLWCKKIKSERHMRDCAGILKIQKNKLDEKYLSLWAKKLKVEKLLQEAADPEFNY